MLRCRHEVKICGPMLNTTRAQCLLRLGIPADNFTALFAMARSVGWLAHFIEDRQDNRIFRPKAEYTGQQYRDLSA